MMVKRKTQAKTVFKAPFADRLHVRRSQTLHVDVPSITNVPLTSANFDFPRATANVPLVESMTLLYFGSAVILYFTLAGDK
jgi:hypothetical protein